MFTIYTNQSVLEWTLEDILCYKEVLTYHGGL